MAIRRVFVPKVGQDKQKVVIIGIDFGTSFTKVYFNQDGEIKQPIQFEVNGVKSFFLPTELFYNPKKNEVCLHELPDCEIIRYFKYSMISDELTTSTNLTNHNKSLKVKPELLCSVYFLACLIKRVKKQISDILKTKDIKYIINMGCPINNFTDKNKGIYDKVLATAYCLSDNVPTDGMNITDLCQYYGRYNQINPNLPPNLQTVPELYAEALWFIEQPSTGEGLYTILDIGGGTVDFATISVTRTEEGEKRTQIYSQKVMPLGIEMLLQYMYPSEYIFERETCIDSLKIKDIRLPFGWKSEYNEDRKLKKAHEFDVEFATGIGEVKERNQKLMEKQNSRNTIIPYYTFGGGADFNWYHSIIRSHRTAFEKANIPPPTRQLVLLEGIPDNRLIIAEQLTRSSFPQINGFPWQFDRECIFSGIDRDSSSEHKSTLESNHRLSEVQEEKSNNSVINRSINHPNETFVTPKAKTQVIKHKIPQHNDQLAKKLKRDKHVSVKCPCCTKVLNKENYFIHLKAHSNNFTYKIFFKNLTKIDKVLCPYCFYVFEEREATHFLMHLEESHPLEFKIKFMKKNELVHCKQCASMILGVHPAIIVQHLLDGCQRNCIS